MRGRHALVVHDEVRHEIGQRQRSKRPERVRPRDDGDVAIGPLGVRYDEGRAELGTARSNNVATMEAFHVDPTETRQQWTESLEVIAMQDIEKAYGRMLKNDVKYRFVIDMASL